MLIIVLNLHLLLSYYTNYNDIEHVEMYMYIYIYIFLLSVCKKKAYVRNSLR